MPPRRSSRKSNPTARATTSRQSSSNATPGPSTLPASASPVPSGQGTAQRHSLAQGETPTAQTYTPWYTAGTPSLAQFPPQAWPHRPLFSNQSSATAPQPDPSAPPPPPFPQTWSILPIPGKLDTYQCRPITAAVGFGTYLPPPGGYPVYGFGTFPDMSSTTTTTTTTTATQKAPKNTTSAAGASSNAKSKPRTQVYPTPNAFPQLPAYMTGVTSTASSSGASSSTSIHTPAATTSTNPRTAGLNPIGTTGSSIGIMTSSDTGLVAPPTKHPEPDFGPPPQPPDLIVQDTYVWCGRIDDKPSLDEDLGVWMNKRCRHLILRSMEGVQHHYREVHGMEWFTNDQKCNWGSSCKVRKTGKNIPKHVFDLHIAGPERLCESKGCKLPQERDSRWCKSKACKRVEPVPENVYV